MSIQALYTAATGMESLQTKLDVIANNMANINTTAFKKDRANFEDLIYRNYTLPGVQDLQGNLTPVGKHVGLGTRVESTQIDFAQGAYTQTNRELDVAIEGKGFIAVQDPATGQNVYTRSGNLSINANGQLVIGSANDGRLLVGAPTIPPDTTAITIGPDGKVSVKQSSSSTLNQVGQVQLYNFQNPEGLLKLGENLYQDTPASGTALSGTAGQNGLGAIRQGSLEASNVEPVNELIDLITTQRSFELNSQTVQAGDQVLQLIGNLRRF
jgi:flagellar basal-body rod protein FlgG